MELLIAMILLVVVGVVGCGVVLWLYRGPRGKDLCKVISAPGVPRAPWMDDEMTFNAFTKRYEEHLIESKIVQFRRDEIRRLINDDPRHPLRRFRGYRSRVLQLRIGSG